MFCTFIYIGNEKNKMIYEITSILFYKKLEQIYLNFYGFISKLLIHYTAFCITVNFSGMYVRRKARYGCIGFVTFYFLTYPHTYLYYYKILYIKELEDTAQTKNILFSKIKKTLLYQ
jgi:hypothetical protein